MNIRTFGTLGALSLASTLAVSVARADVTFATSNSGAEASGSASFAIVGGNLQVTIVDNSTVGTTDPADVLTALFFQGGGNNLTIKSETLPGADTFYNGTGAGTKLGTDTSLTSGATIAGVALDAWQSADKNSTFGLGIGGLNFFGGINKPFDGLVSASYNPAKGTGNLKNGGTDPFSDEIIITLTGTSLSLDTIKDVAFNFGTDYGPVAATEVAAVPEPTTLLAGALVLLPFCGGLVRAWRKNR